MKFNRSVFQALAMVGQFGINMLVPIFMCAFAGILLDRLLKTSFLVVILFFIGALAGFRNVYQFAKRIYSRDVTEKREIGKQGSSDEDSKDKN